MTTIVGHTTRASGTVLTASIYNTDHVVHITNAQNLNNDKLEGATPPVTQGNVAVFADTSGTLLEDGGLVAADQNRTLTAGTGLTGGGDLSANRSFAVDFASQAEAEGGTDTDNVMNALRTRQQVVAFQASQAEAEAATDNTKIITPLRARQQAQAFFASQAEAEAGTDNTKFMTPLRVAEAIAALTGSVNVGASLTTFNASTIWDTGVDAVGAAAAFAMQNVQTSPQNPSISLDGGSTFTTLFSTTGVNSLDLIALVFVANDKVLVMRWGQTVTSSTPANVSSISLLSPTVASGNIKFSGSTNQNWEGVQIF